MQVLFLRSLQGAITIKHACSHPLVSDSVIKTLTVAVLEPEFTIFEGVGDIII